VTRQTDSKHLLVAALERQLFNGEQPFLAAEGGRNGDEVAARRRSLHTQLEVRFSAK
jgi:hypothetical protein